MKFFLIISVVLLFNYFVNAQDDCVRAEPVPILKKSVFLKKKFKLTKNKDYPAEKIGYESVKVNKEIDLTIINSGCENYTLTFQFLIPKQSISQNNVKFWYRKAIELMNLVKKGIRKEDVNLIERGLKAVSVYTKRTKLPKFEAEIDFGGKDIRDVVILNKITSTGNKQKLEISFGVGPL